jgi:hypothetical protein
MFALGVQLAASVVILCIRRLKTKQNVEKAELPNRRRDLQQFFTSFTNRNGTLYYEYCFTGAGRRGWAGVISMY